MAPLECVSIPVASIGCLLSQLPPCASRHYAHYAHPVVQPARYSMSACARMRTGTAASRGLQGHAPYRCRQSHRFSKRSKIEAVALRTAGCALATRAAKAMVQEVDALLCISMMHQWNNPQEGKSRLAIWKLMRQQPGKLSSRSQQLLKVQNAFEAQQRRM